MLPGLPGIISSVPAGGGVPLDTRSITVSADQGEHNLRTLADADGYNGTDDLALTVTYTANQIGTTVGTKLIETGTIPNTGGASTITIIINSGVNLKGLGGDGGNGSTHVIDDPDGKPGQNGQDCFVINTGDTSIPITITNNGTYWSGGGGGGGGGQGNTNGRDGGGGGGGASNGVGGSAPGANDGDNATETTGGNGGAGIGTGGDGGDGGNRGANGLDGQNGSIGDSGAKGFAGKRIRKNGHTVTEDGSGTSFGPVVA